MRKTGAVFSLAHTERAIYYVVICGASCDKLVTEVAKDLKRPHTGSAISLCLVGHFLGALLEVLKNWHLQHARRTRFVTCRT